MRSFIIISALLVAFAFCGYPTPEAYPTAPPKYPMVQPPANPIPYTGSYNQEESDSSIESDDTTTATTDFRRRAKARTVQNRQFHRRALQPIRRQKKAKQ